MNADSPEFQTAAQEAAEMVRGLILALSKSKGQTAKTALTGAMGAVAEVFMDSRPEGMSEEDAASNAVITLANYCRQYIEGCGIDGVEDPVSKATH